MPAADPTIRNQQVQFPAPNFRDGGATVARSSLYGNLWLSNGDGKPLLVGYMKSMDFEETNGLDLDPQIGNDYMEPVPGARRWAGNGSRMQVRGGDLPEILKQKYPNVIDIDFRFLPFTWQYTFTFDSASGQSTFENAQWSYGLVWITRYRWSVANPYALMSEDFSWVGRGLARNDNGGMSMMNLPALRGTPNAATLNTNQLSGGTDPSGIRD